MISEIDIPSHLRQYRQNRDVEELADRVYGEIGMPLSQYAVAAKLESMGFQDRYVELETPYNSVFELAVDVYQVLIKRLQHQVLNGDLSSYQSVTDRLSAGGILVGIWSFIRDYSLGLLFMAPLVSQILAIIFTSYALWAWLYFNIFQASVIAFGTILAFIATGGLTLSASREISRYVASNNYNLGYKIVKRYLLMGTVALLLLAALIYAINLITLFFPQQGMLISLVYMVVIGFWILSSVITYALKIYHWILLSVLAGTVFVITGMEYLHIGIYLSHWIGIGISSLIMSGYGIIFFYSQSGEKEEQIFQEQKLPPFEVLYYTNYQYFLYGTAYFAFLFLDRILAWSANNTNQPYIIWFDTAYELGMDWALIGFMLVTASLEYSIRKFSKIILPLQKQANPLFPESFNKYFQRFYWRQVILLIVIGCIAIVANYYLVSSLQYYEAQYQVVNDFFVSDIVFKVFWLASVGYLATSFGLLNSLFFFTLGKPGPVLQGIGGAIMANIIVGYLCSRLISYEYATIGLIAGGFAFASITGFHIIKFFKKLDYNYYSSY